ncbi:MAG: TonB-dependent receptor [Chitinophagaceae bacterium]|nr:TonB-dependent receptor [Chitinophagaceae bacterium]
MQSLSRLICLIVSSALLFLHAAAQVRTGITGTVTDGKSPMPGVTIKVVETGQTMASGAGGEYTFLIKPGEYTIQFQSVGHKSITRRVVVHQQQMERLSITMSVESKMLEAVTVGTARRATTARALLELRRQSTNIQDAIGAIQIEKSASITTAQALQRVTGVTVKDGKYVTVRGLSDRNVVVQLNGGRLAGADAGRSSVAVDLIPAQLLDNIIVEKSITPDKPGDANGAVVEIQTKSIPDARFLTISAQTGFNGNIGLYGYANSFQGGDIGFWGQNVNKLNLTNDYQRLINEYTARGYSTATGTIGAGLQEAIKASNIDKAHFDEAIRINRVMEQGFSQVLTTKARTFGPDQIYGISYGDRHLLKNNKIIGFVIGVNYYNRSQSNPNGENNLYSVREPLTPGSNAGAPNINYPNELRMVNLYRLRENTGNRNLNYGGLATLSFRFNKFNDLSFTYNGNFGSEVTATMEDGLSNANLKAVDPNIPPFFPDHQRIYDFILRSTHRSLNSFQLRGDHKFRLIKKLRPWQLTYSLSQSLASQNDPDYRDTKMRVDSLGRIPNPAPPYTNGPRDLLIPTEYQHTYFVASDRYYRNLDEHNQNYKADLVAPFRISKDTISIFKAGAYYYSRVRDYHESLFNRTDNSSTYFNNYGGYSQLPGNLTTLNGDLTAWSGPGQIGIIENANLKEGQSMVPGYLYTPQAGVTTLTGPNGTTLFINSYHAKQSVGALYSMVDLNINKDWRVIGGLRIESTSFESTPDTTGSNFIDRSGVKTKEQFDRSYRTDYLTYNWLPSGSIVYKGIKNVNFRAAYSRTLIRPELNEIVLSAQRDPIQQLTIYGNKALQNGIFSNYDFRADWFIGTEELVSASVFYKTVDRQIERVYTNGTIDQYGFVNSFVTFRNNPRQGKVYGVEMEVRKNLQPLFDMGRYIFVGANLILAKSETTIDPTEYYVIRILDRHASNTRPLVDQPNIAYNVNIDFDYPKWGTQFNALYNVTGKRLSDINSDGSPNIYEFPAQALDFVFAQKITKKLEFKAFVKNALNSPTKFYYANSGNGKQFGADHQEYLRRAYNYGTVYTLGLKYTF